MQDYLVSVKRGARDTVPADWQQQLALIPGVTVRSVLTSGFAVIDATADGYVEAERRLGAWLWFERQILHEFHGASN